MPTNLPPPTSRLNVRERYDSLVGLRALSAIGIVMMHVQSNMTIKPDLGCATDRIIPFFTDFTLLFMMLSAFSMCCGYYDRVKYNQITPNDFYKRRYQRILPFFALLVIIDLITEPVWSSFCEAFADLTLCFNFLNAEIEVIGVGWFLGTIFVFYFMFPFFVFMLDNRKRAWISTLIGLVFCYIAIDYFEVSERANIIYSSPYFLVGGLIYLYRSKLADISVKNNWLVLLFCIAISIMFFVVDIPNLFLHMFTETIVFGSWIVYALRNSNVILNNKLMKLISTISMEIYLCHMLFYRIVEKGHLDNLISNNNVLYFSTVVFVLLGAGVFSYIIKNYCFPIVGKIVQFYND